MKQRIIERLYRLRDDLGATGMAALVLFVAAALSYVLNLSRSEALSAVQLVRHEVKQNDPQHPVAFSVSAAWNEVKR